MAGKKTEKKKDGGKHPESGKERVQLLLPAASKEKLDAYRYENKIASRSKAVEVIIDGLKLNADAKTKKAG